MNRQSHQEVLEEMLEQQKSDARARGMRSTGDYRVNPRDIFNGLRGGGKATHVVASVEDPSGAMLEKEERYDNAEKYLRGELLPSELDGAYRIDFRPGDDLKRSYLAASVRSRPPGEHLRFMFADMDQGGYDSAICLKSVEKDLLPQNPFDGGPRP